jgi:predicted nucleic-acid-binding protein
MIGVDVNILVRYAVKDDPQQTVLATQPKAKALDSMPLSLKLKLWTPCHSA